MSNPSVGLAPPTVDVDRGNKYSCCCSDDKNTFSSWRSRPNSQVTPKKKLKRKNKKDARPAHVRIFAFYFRFAFYWLEAATTMLKRRRWCLMHTHKSLFWWGMGVEAYYCVKRNDTPLHLYRFVRRSQRWRRRRRRRWWWKRRWYWHFPQRHLFIDLCVVFMIDMASVRDFKSRYFKNWRKTR